MRFIQLAILILTLQACANKGKQDYKSMTYLKSKESHLLQKVVVNNSQITVKYLRKEVEMMLTSKRDNDTSNNNYDMFLYFEININKRNFKIDDVNSQNYLNFYIQNDFKLVNNTDTIIPAFCQKISDGIKDNNKYIVVFTKPEKLSDNFLFIYDDKLFGVGKQKFSYYTSELKKLPV